MTLHRTIQNFLNVQNEKTLIETISLNMCFENFQSISYDYISHNATFLSLSIVKLKSVSMNGSI